MASYPSSTVRILVWRGSSCSSLNASHVKVLPLNPFLEITTESCEESFRTKKCIHTSQPNWIDDILYVPVSSTDSGLRFSVRSKSRGWRATTIGSAFLALNEVLEAEEHSDFTLQLLSSKEHPRGHILVSLDFNAVQSSTFPSDVGVVRLLLYEGKDLQEAIATLKKPSPKAQVRSIVSGEGKDSKVVFTTPIAHHTENPKWSSCYDFICSNKYTTTISVVVTDTKVKDSTLGDMRIPLRDLLDASDGDSVWWPLSGSAKGQLKMRAEWKAIAMSMG